MSDVSILLVYLNKFEQITFRHRDVIRDSAATANGPWIQNVLMLLITLVQICASHLFFTGMQFKTLLLLPMALA